MARSRRSNRRPYGAPVPELNLERATGGRSTEQRRGEDWVVQRIRSSDKSYTCPGCGATIAPGEPHVAAWRAETVLGARDGIANRRHWHVPCWRIGP